MKQTIWKSCAAAALLLLSSLASPAWAQSLTTSADRPTVPVNSSYFTGTAWSEWYFRPEAPSRLYGALVTFAPGARTHWHIHPLGQTLIVTSGTGYVQERGQAPVFVKPGDIIRSTPGVSHWHGASADSIMSHIALSETGGTVTWEEEVTDEDYEKAKEVHPK